MQIQLVACMVLPAALLLALTTLSADAQTAVQPAGPACIDAPDSPPDAVIAACTARLAIPDLPDAGMADAYAIRAGIFERRGQPGPAIDDLSQVIRRRGASAPMFRKRAALYRLIGDEDRAVSDLTEAIRLEPRHSLTIFDRAELFRKKGDRRRAFIDYGAVLTIDPGFEPARVHRMALAREIEKIGALMPVAVRPSFDCESAQRAVEKAICADLELSQLDRDLDAEFRQALVKTQPQRAAVIRIGQENFIATRNMSFGQAGYDLRRAMNERLAALRAGAN